MSDCKHLLVLKTLTLTLINYKKVWALAFNYYGLCTFKILHSKG